MIPAERRAVREEEEFKMEIKKLKETNEKLIFEMSDTNEVEANTLRRLKERLQDVKNNIEWLNENRDNICQDKDITYPKQVVDILLNNR